MISIRKSESGGETQSLESIDHQSTLASRESFSVSNASLLNININSSPELSPGAQHCALASTNVVTYPISRIPRDASGLRGWIAYVMQANGLDELVAKIPHDAASETFKAYETVSQAFQAAHEARIGPVKELLEAFGNGLGIQELSQERLEKLVYQKTYDAILRIARRASYLGDVDLISLCFYQAERCIEACHSIEMAPRRDVKPIWGRGHANACENRIGQIIQCAKRGDVVEARKLVRDAMKNFSKAGSEIVCLSRIQRQFYPEVALDSPIGKMLNLGQQSRMSLDSICKTLVHSALNNEIENLVGNVNQVFSEIRIAFADLSRIFRSDKIRLNAVYGHALTRRRDAIVEKLCACEQETMHVLDSEQVDALDDLREGMQFLVGDFDELSKKSPELLNEHVTEQVSSFSEKLEKLKQKMKIDIEKDDESDAFSISKKSKESLRSGVQKLLQVGAESKDIEQIIASFIRADEFLFREKRKSQAGPNTLLESMDLPLTNYILGFSRDKDFALVYEIYKFFSQKDFSKPLNRNQLSQSLLKFAKKHKVNQIVDDVQRFYECMMAYHEKMISSALVRISEISQSSQSQEALKRALKLRRMLVSYYVGHLEKVLSELRSLKKKKAVFKSDAKNIYDIARQLFSLVYRIDRCATVGQFELSSLQNVVLEQAKKEYEDIAIEKEELPKFRGVDRAIRKIKFWTPMGKNKGVRFSDKMDVFDIPNRVQMDSLDHMSQDLFNMSEKELIDRAKQMDREARFFAIKSDMSMLLSALHEFRVYFWGLNTYFPRKSTVFFDGMLDDLVNLGCLKRACDMYVVAADDAKLNRIQSLPSSLENIACYADLGGFERPVTKDLLQRGFAGAIAEELKLAQKNLDEKDLEKSKKYEDRAREYMALYQSKKTCLLPYF